MHFKYLLLKLFFLLKSKQITQKKKVYSLFSIFILTTTAFSSCKSLNLFQDPASNRCLVIGG